MSKIVYIALGGIIYYFIEYKYNFFSNILSDLSWKQKLLILIIGLVIVNLLDKLADYLDKSENGSDDNSDDIFFDQAPNPLPPPTFPPTEDQLEFTEFMKKMEREKEKVPVKRE